MNVKAYGAVLIALLGIFSASNCIAARVTVGESHKQFVINLANRIGSALTLVDSPSSSSLDQPHADEAVNLRHAHQSKSPAFKSPDATRKAHGVSIARGIR